jgi:hypothetical protein
MRKHRRAMVVRESGKDAYEIVAHDDFARVCSGRTRRRWGPEGSMGPPVVMGSPFDGVVAGALVERGDPEAPHSGGF